MNGGYRSPEIKMQMQIEMEMKMQVETIEMNKPSDRNPTPKARLNNKQNTSPLPGRSSLRLEGEW